VSFATVTEEHAETEDPSALPWAVVKAPDESPYRGGFTPVPDSSDRIGESTGSDRDLYSVKTADLPVMLEVEIVASKADRIVLVRELESELLMSPLLRQREAGITVELPYYMGYRAKYVAAAIRRVNSPDEARRDRFGAVMKVSATIPVARIVERPKAKARLSTSVK
jgi:hypothetical protein